MADNPYAAPATVEQRSLDSILNLPPPRPLGISILSILHLVGGLVLIVGLLLVILNNAGGAEEALSAIGVPVAVMIVAVLFLSGLAFASAVGMWLGRRWGWWLGAFYCVYGIFRAGSAIATYIALSGELGEPDGPPNMYVTKYGGRIIVNALLFLYFFKPNVLEYFGLVQLKKVQAAGIVVGMGIALSVGASVVSLLLAG